MRSKTIRLIFLFITISFSTILKAQSPSFINDFAEKWCHQPLLNHASIAFCMVDSKTGKVILEKNAGQSMAPASNMKLLTTATALEKLGPDFQFSTKLAYRGEIRNDTLKGDLIIVGGGDPALGSHYFKNNYFNPFFLEQWSRTLRRAKIKYIQGNLIADVSIFDDRSIPSTWIWEDMGNYYGAGPSALNIYDNTVTIHFFSPTIPDRQTTILKTTPEVPGMSFKNEVKSSLEQSDEAYVYGSPNDFHRIIRGTIPRDKSDFRVKASVPDPPLLILNQFKQRLSADSVELAGSLQVLHQPVLPADSILAITFSPSLRQIIDVTNHESVNLFAETLLKYMAYTEGSPGTTQNGIRLVSEFWKNKGIATDGLCMMDGSGLSRFNMVTPRQITQLLLYMKNRSKYGKAFFESLPAAPNGTLWYFHAANFPDSSLRAKSGSMTRIRCFSGSLTTVHHKEILFSIMLNNFSCSQSSAIAAIENLLTAIRLKQ